MIAEDVEDAVVAGVASALEDDGTVVSGVADGTGVCLTLVHATDVHTQW